MHFYDIITVENEGTGIPLSFSTITSLDQGSADCFEKPDRIELDRLVNFENLYNQVSPIPGLDTEYIDHVNLEIELGCKLTGKFCR